ncbi:MAG: hypothetical protein V4543_16385 [Bacteroidota bacterium]
MGPENQYIDSMPSASEFASKPGVNFGATESMESFFGSKGIITFKDSGNNYRHDIVFLNPDNSVFANLNFARQKIAFNKETYTFTQIAGDTTVLDKYDFKPKGFYPADYNILLLEYSEIQSGYATVFINHAKNIKKRIKLNKQMYNAEPWEKHLKSVVIGFNPVLNPIMKSNSPRSGLKGYVQFRDREEPETGYAFRIDEISGDWAKISCIEYCDSPCYTNQKYDGWILWRANGKLLIELHYAC